MRELQRGKPGGALATAASAAAGSARAARAAALDFWASRAARALGTWAQRRVLLGLVALELITAALTCVFFTRHTQVTQLGLGFWRAGAYTVCAGFRACSACFGFYAVLRRSNSLVRFYFGLFCVNAVNGMLALVPILRLDCECSSWVQCDALATFGTSDSPLLNPFPEPDSAYLDSKRHVPYREPPADPERAEPVARAGGSAAAAPAHGGAAAQAPRPATPNGAPRGSSAAQAVSITARGRLVAKRRGDRGAGQGALDAPGGDAEAAAAVGATRAAALGGNESQPAAAPVKEAGAPGTAAGAGASPAATTAAATASVSARGAPGLLQRRAAGPGPDAAGVEAGALPLHFFNVTGEGLAWVSDRPPSCQGRGVSPGEAAALGGRWAAARRASRSDAQEELDVDQQLNTALWLCALDHTCGVVSAELYQDGSGDMRVAFCQLEEQVLPLAVRNASVRAGSRIAMSFARAADGMVDLMRTGTPDEREALLALGQGSGVRANETLVDSIYFKRNQVLVRKELDRDENSRGALYSQVFASSDAFGGMQLLNSILEGECRCGGKFDTCHVYQDELHKDRYWCSVSPALQQTCFNRGIRLLWDEVREVMWTEELCPARCACSNVGAPPPADVQGRLEEHVDKSLLWENQLNYGSVCRRWKTTDPWKWCFVGWDSACPDRVRDEPTHARRSRDGANLVVPAQYRSRLPCDQRGQLEVIHEAHHRCLDTTVAATIALLAMAVVCLPMGVILFKFLSNRCGDEFKAEAQFNVVLDSDDPDSSEEEDEPRPVPQRGSRRSTSGASRREAAGAAAGTALD